MSTLFKKLWYGLDLTRKIFLNFIFLLLLVWIISAISSSGDRPDVENGVALVLNPKGNIVEQLTYKDPIDAALSEVSGSNESPETLLYDLIDAIEKAKNDDRITLMVISTKNLWGAGVTKLQDLAVAIKDFKVSGKQVIAYDDNYSQTQYYLAANADKVFMNPQGGVFLVGFARIGTYFKSLLEKLEINMHIFKVGVYKSAVEPFIRDNMSEEAKLANKAWLGDLWADFIQNIASNRSISSSDVSSYIENYKESLIEFEGDTAKLTIESRLVDELMTRSDFREHMIKLVGKDKEHKSFKQISHQSYLKAIRKPFNFNNNNNKKVAVITAKGAILDGEHKEGSIGGDTVARIIRKTRQNKNVKAIVLRVESGGGSAFASEIIREELVKAQEDGIKVVVSMGDVAASGGYWISATADEIWARPSSITGSIGIFGLLATFEKPLNKYGIFRDGVGTTKYANAVDIGQPLSQDVADIVQTQINAGYEKFLALVAKGRNMTRDEVDKIAQGRVWSGQQAHDLGLVDSLGSLNDAIKSAAKLAEVENYDVWFVKRELSERELFLRELLGSAKISDEFLNHSRNAGSQSLKSKFIQGVNNSLFELEKWNDPNNTYANCFCEIK